MSIMDIFRGKAPEQAQAPATLDTQPAKPDQNPVQPNPPGATGEADPMEKFKDLWNPLTPEQQEAGQNFDPETMFSVDPARLQEAASKMDFTKTMNAQQLEAIKNGGDDAVAALAAIMNSTAQQAVSTSMLASSEMVKQAMVQANSKLDTRLATGFKSQQVKDMILQENPALNSPAAKPFVDALQSAMMMKNPQASSAELREGINEFLNSLAVATNQPKARAAQEAERKKDKDTDFSSFLDGLN